MVEGTNKGDIEAGRGEAEDVVKGITSNRPEVVTVISGMSIDAVSPNTVYLISNLMFRISPVNVVATDFAAVDVPQTYW